MDNVAANPSDYTQRERLAVFLATNLGALFDFYDIFNLSFILPAIRRSLGISLLQAGLLMTVTHWFSVVGGILFGWTGDRIGRKRTLVLMLWLIGISSVACAFSNNYVELLCARALMGIGVGGEWGAGAVLFAEVWRPQSRGLGSGLLQGTQCLAVIGGAALSTALLRSFGDDPGWRLVFLTGAISAVLAVVVTLSAPESRLWIAYRRVSLEANPPQVRHQKPLLSAVRRTGILRTSVWCALLTSAMFFNYSGIVMFLPTLMSTALHAPIFAVRDVIMGGTAVLWLLTISAAGLSDRYGRRPIVAVSSAIGAIASIAMLSWGIRTPFSGSILAWPFFLCFAVWEFGTAGVGILAAWFPELFPVDLRASASSTVYTIGRLGAGLADVMVPGIAQYFAIGLPKAMICVAPAGFLAAIMALALPETAGLVFEIPEGKEPTETTAAS